MLKAWRSPGIAASLCRFPSASAAVSRTSQSSSTKAWRSPGIAASLCSFPRASAALQYTDQFSAFKALRRFGRTASERVSPNNSTHNSLDKDCDEIAPTVASWNLCGTSPANREPQYKSTSSPNRVTEVPPFLPCTSPATNATDSLQSSKFR